MIPLTLGTRPGFVADCERSAPRRMQGMFTLAADRGDAGRRLDLVLRRHLAGVRGATRTRVQGWIEDGQVSVNGKPVLRVAARTAAGDVVTVQGLEAAAFARSAPASLAEARAGGMRERRPGGWGLGAEGAKPSPEPGARSLEPAEILFEDDSLLAVAKPAGIVVHPTYKHASGTLLDAVRAYGRSWSDSCQPSVVGRLDKLTSGLVIVAKGPVVHHQLQVAMASAEKHYLAVVHGRVNTARGTIDLKLARDPGDRRRVVASETVGARSRTEFERLARTREASLLQCRLLTGRMHQIRAHLFARGWPIVGDPKYTDPRRPALGFTRQALHAWRTTFRHPVGGARIVIEAPVPEDLNELLVRILGPCWSDVLPRSSSRSSS